MEGWKLLSWSPTRKFRECSSKSFDLDFEEIFLGAC